MKKKALVIAVDEYHDYPLQGCVNDATRLGALLEGSHCGFEVTTLLNKQASRGEIRKNLEWLFDDAQESLFFFAGHGWRRPTGTYLVTHDYELHDEGIDLQWLAGAVKKLSAPESTVIFVIDACHSGDGTIRSLGTSSERDANIDDLKGLLPQGVSRVMLAACKGHEVALELVHEGASHGAFSHYLCEALEGYAANEDKSVTINSAYDYVAERLKAEGRQTPVLRGDQEGQLILARNVTKKGTWKPTPRNALSLVDAISRGEDLLGRAQAAISSPGTYEDWLNHGYAAACQAFLPVLTWYRRRADIQEELLHDANFKRLYDSCMHMHKQLCGLSPGTRIANGRLTDSIGGGSFGNVWNVRESSHGVPVCFKNYHSHDILDSNKTGRFRRGYEAMRQLDHPHIVKVLELSEVPFGFYMQFVRGANLRQLNPGATSEPLIIATLLLEVAETLRHAHGRGVIHRDVKPENIVVEISDTNEYSAFLTDFDLAWFSAATQVTKVADGFGSHFYAAPEQINAPQSNVAHRATVDVYAFGQLCFFCSCGRDPMAFDRTSNERALMEELGRRWNDARASAVMLKLFRDCTELAPAKRIQDFRTICELLSKLQLSLLSPAADLSSERFLEELRFALTGNFTADPLTGRSLSLRSRSLRTGMEAQMTKDAASMCALEISFHPNDLLIEGRKAADVRSLVNSRIDATLAEFRAEHDTARKGAKVGAFEISVKIDKLGKSREGVLRAKEIISRVIDQLEFA